MCRIIVKGSGADTVRPKVQYVRFKVRVCASFLALSPSHSSSLHANHAPLMYLVVMPAHLISQLRSQTF